MKARPKKVLITEVGPRDGFQMERKVVPTRLKAFIIKRFAKAGIREIQAASFVHPGRIPQMADAEELLNSLQSDGIFCSYLVLNRKGFERAASAGALKLEISVSASDTHSRRNMGKGSLEALEECLSLVRQAKDNNLWVKVSIQCSFGCAYEGEIPFERILKTAEALLAEGPDVLCLADTTGMATPTAIRNSLERIIPAANNVPLALHLHDTMGLGLVNLVAALEMGIDRFDTAAGGMGGCPFVENAAGNIPTEETVFLLESLGISTGIDIGSVAACSRIMSRYFKKEFSGRLYRLKRIGCCHAQPEPDFETAIRRAIIST